MARAVAVALLAGAVTASAAATGPAPGRYTCTVGAYQQVSGTLRIFTGHRYRFRQGKLGRFTVNGHALRFVTGPWHGKYAGRFYRADGVREIAAKPVHGGLTRFCDMR